METAQVPKGFLVQVSFPLRIRSLGRPALVLVVSVASLSVSAAVGPDAAAAPATPAATTADGQVLVVTANLQEAFGSEDLSNLGEIDVFTDRLSTLVPLAPDVLLLQEVRDTSAARVATRLTAITGHDYVVSVNPGPDPWRETDYKVIKKETAVVVNADTMTASSAGAYIETTYSRSQSAGGDNPEVKKQAYVNLTETASGWKLPMVSLHYTLAQKLASKKISDDKRRAWSVKIADFLNTKYPGADHDTIAGDFNGGRCSVLPCQIAPFYSALTSEARAYHDCIFTVVDDPGVDFIFSTGGVIDAGTDAGYDPDAARGTSAYYSDHPFRWAIVSSDSSPPSTPTGLRGSSGNVDVSLSWNASSDPGTGVAGYEIWRGQALDDMRLRAKTTATNWVDESTYVGKSYTYYVIAYDAAHNRSQETSAIQVRAYRD
jgi:hypothetical protein